MGTPLKIGITGGIGSGKSIVSKVFHELGIPIFDADSEAKRLMNENPIIQEQLIEKFGAEVYQNNQLDRAYLAKKVFDNPDALAALNQIVHPITIQAANDWMHAQTTPYVVKEAALFFESGTAGDLDYIVGVYAPKMIRLERVKKRDNADLKSIQNRMNNQLDEEMKMRLCDFIIINDDTQLLMPQILELHEKFLVLANKSLANVVFL